MKRLLAYLFIVLGLGLTFNVSAHATTIKFQNCVPGLKDGPFKDFRYWTTYEVDLRINKVIATNGSLATDLSPVSSYKIEHEIELNNSNKLLTKKIQRTKYKWDQLEFNKKTNKVREIRTAYLDGKVKKVNGTWKLTDYRIDESFTYEHCDKVIGSWKNNKTQIAKAELSQTQKMAKKISNPSFDVDAKSVILIDSNSNEVLYEKNADTKISPASMTKIMTTVIAFDLIKKGKLNLNDKFLISKKAWKLTSLGYSSMFLIKNDKVSIENLLRGIIVASGNDACIALAEGIAGTEENFVKLMNKKANQIGLKNTNFENSTGINNSKNYSSVRDIAILSSYMIKNYPKLYSYYSEKSFVWNRTGGDPIKQGNRNPLLYKNILGVDGIKTGYLSSEKYQLASSMKLSNNQRLISVGSGFPSKNARSKESAKLLTWAKNNYQKFKIAKVEPDKSELIDDTDKIADLISKAKNPEPGTYSPDGDSDQIVAKIISNKIATCWSIPMGLPATEKNLMVRIKLSLNYDGSIKKIELLNHSRMNQPGQGFYKVLAESVLRATRSCAPFNVRIANNQEVLIKVDARNILFGKPSIEKNITDIAKAEPSQTQKWTIENISKLERAVHNQNESESVLFNLYKKYKFTPNDLYYAPRDYVKFERPKGRALLYQSILLSVDKNDGDSIVLDSFVLKKAFERDGLENAFVFELSKLLKKAKNPAKNYEVFYKENIEPKKTQIAKAEPSYTIIYRANANGDVNRKKGSGNFYQGISTLNMDDAIKNAINTCEQTPHYKNNKCKIFKTFEEKIELTDSQIAKAEPTLKPKKKVKVAKVDEPKQEEFKPKKTNQDNEAPVITIAEAITVNDTSYILEGRVTDKANKIFVEIDGQPVQVKKGKFKVKRYSPVDEQIKIVAIDQWGNKSKTKLVNITIDIDETIVANKLEPLNPSNISNKSSNNKVALIIGIENYTEAPKANYANLDAKYFFDYARRAFGVNKQNINLLVNEEATVVKTDKAVSLWLKSKIKKNKSDLIIFFAGHGLASSDGKELYLLPQDGNPDRLERTALSRTDLFKEIISLNPKSVTMFLDTCYSGVSRDEQMLLASARPIRIVADEQEGIPDNFTIFSASQLDQISSGLKEANHGIFSYYLMKGMEGNADINKDKKITNGELLAYMDENVSQKAAEQGREQNPSLAGDPDKVLMSYR